MFWKQKNTKKWFTICRWRNLVWLKEECIEKGNTCEPFCFSRIEYLEWGEIRTSILCCMWLQSDQAYSWTKKAPWASLQLMGPWLNEFISVVQPWEFLGTGARKGHISPALTILKVSLSFFWRFRWVISKLHSQNIWMNLQIIQLSTLKVFVVVLHPEIHCASMQNWWKAFLWCNK